MSINIRPLISIITPSFNSERFIERTILSVISQTYTNWEMIICDDASTDNSRKIIGKWVKIEPKIRLISLETNKGVANARNKALNECKGDFIAFLDSDDIWLQEKLQKQITFLQKENTSFVCCGYSFINENDEIIGKPVAVPSIANYGSIIKTNTIPCLTVIIASSMIKEIRFKDLPHEDYAFWLQILREKDTQIHGLNEDLARYRILRKSRSANKIKAAKHIWKIYRTEHIGFVKSVFYFLHYVIFNSFKHLRRRLLNL